MMEDVLCQSTFQKIPSQNSAGHRPDSGESGSPRSVIRSFGILCPAHLPIPFVSLRVTNESYQKALQNCILHISLEVSSQLHEPKPNHQQNLSRSRIIKVIKVRLLLLTYLNLPLPTLHLLYNLPNKRPEPLLRQPHPSHIHLIRLYRLPII